MTVSIIIWMHYVVQNSYLKAQQQVGTVKEANFEQQANFEHFRKVLFACLAGQIRLK